MKTLRKYAYLKPFMLFVAAWMLVLISGVSVNLHFCQNTVKSFSLIGQAPNCHEMMAKSSCAAHKKSCQNTCSASSKQENKNCCTNKDLQLELDADLLKVEIEPFHFHTFSIDWVAVLPQQITEVYYYNYFIPQPVEKSNFQHYRPPPLYSNYIKLYEQFLC